MRYVIALFLIWTAWAVFLAISMGPRTSVLSTCDRKAVQPSVTQPPGYPSTQSRLDSSPLRKRQWVTERVEFPFQIRSRGLRSLARDTLIVTDSNTGEHFRFSPQIDNAPLQISRIVPWRDALIVWSALELLPMDGARRNLEYRQFLIAADNGVATMELHDNFAPWLADSKRNLLFSLEVRPKVIGGQPREQDLPAQRVRIASLSKPGEPPAYFSVRSLDKLFVHPTGDLIVLRWDLKYLQPGSWGAYSLFLDRRSFPTYELLWSTELVHEAGMAQYGQGPKLHLHYTPESDQAEISYVKIRHKREAVMTSVSLVNGLIQNLETARPYPPRLSSPNCNQGLHVASRI